MSSIEDRIWLIIVFTRRRFFLIKTNNSQVDQFLDKLSELTKEDEQILHFKSIVVKCTANDLKMIIRQVKHDLRITAGPKHM